MEWRLPQRFWSLLWFVIARTKKNKEKVSLSSADGDAFIVHNSIGVTLENIMRDNDRIGRFRRNVLTNRQTSKCVFASLLEQRAWTTVGSFQASAFIRKINFFFFSFIRIRTFHTLRNNGNCCPSTESENRAYLKRVKSIMTVDDFNRLTVTRREPRTSRHFCTCTTKNNTFNVCQFCYCIISCVAKSWDTCWDRLSIDWFRKNWNSIVV